VPDALNDSRFSDSPLVRTGERVRFYAGFPLESPEGLSLGALCALDNKPRQLNRGQEDAMRALARQIMALLELRRVSNRLAAALESLKTLEGLLPVCAWCKRIRNEEGTWNTLEKYVRAHTSADFTHGICPDCKQRMASEIAARSKRS
jgi:GAF domain-containing protein